MNVPTWLWLATIAGFLVILAIDLFVVDHNPHEVKTSEAARWVIFYVALACLFGLGIAIFAGGKYTGEYFAGYITEYSLSVDNLFIFVIIMSSFAVPVIHQHKVLLVGIVLALVMRGAFIAAGAAIISAFQPIFYLFGAFLIYTAWKFAFTNSDDEGDGENRAVRWLRKHLPVTEDYHGAKTTVKINGKRWVTPMLIVMVAIGSTDLLFALDSIPAIFGLTKEPFLVFTANAFALMGLRQLYFLIGGLLRRLIYLNIGLAVILGFIGIKLILEAMHATGMEWAPHVSIQLSLSVIISAIIVTTLASLMKQRWLLFVGLIGIGGGVLIELIFGSLANGGVEWAPHVDSMVSMIVVGAFVLVLLLIALVVRARRGPDATETADPPKDVAAGDPDAPGDAAPVSAANGSAAGDLVVDGSAGADRPDDVDAPERSVGR